MKHDILLGQVYSSSYRLLIGGFAFFALLLLGQNESTCHCVDCWSCKKNCKLSQHEIFPTQQGRHAASVSVVNWPLCFCSLPYWPWCPSRSKGTKWALGSTSLLSQITDLSRGPWPGIHHFVLWVKGNWPKYLEQFVSLSSCIDLFQKQWAMSDPAHAGVSGKLWM